MGILNLRFDEIPELAAVAPGEYGLRITRVTVKPDKNGNMGMLVGFAISAEDSKPISTWLSIPVEGMDDDEIKNRGRRLATFAAAFNIQVESIDELVKMAEAGEVVGAEGLAVLTIEEDTEYGKQNRISRFVIK